jgi:type II secretory pathway pseudopilin PulG
MAVTTAAVIGIAATAASTTMSFVQAGKQKDAMRNAERDADEAMQAARKKLEQNFYDNLSIQKEPYELEREALLAQGAEAIQAGVESERGAAATAGRVQLAQQQGQAGVRSAMSQDLANLEKLSAQEESRLRDVGVQLDLEEVAGAQLAAANAAELAGQAEQQGWQGVVSTAGQVASALPLFAQDSKAQRDALGEMKLSTQEFKDFKNVMGKGGTVSKSMGAAGTGDFTNLDFGKIKNMTNAQYRQFKNELTPQQKKMLFTNQQYLDNYNPFNPFK